ncbi:cytochrome P450 [Plectosphaerella cucumerina]|uniref:Cytochrome P450 n=1 Tax=Plectosphaerella cucumerina TaxID=40658 RepID=A0A8K0T7V8_9PEZI|nr:cytochrome P450 [Plectosphaerella cucumerina]
MSSSAISPGLLARASPTTVAAVVATLAVSWFSVSSFRSYWRLRHIKGPPLAAWSIWWLVRTVGGTRAYLDFWEVNQKYGDIARVGPNDVVCSDPDLMKRVLAVRSEYRRSDWYDGMRFHPKKNNVLSWRDEEEHFKLRSKMAAGYSGREVLDLEGKIDKNLHALIKRLDDDIAAGGPLDFGRKAQYFTLDVITDLAFGDAFGFLATDSDIYDYIRTTEESLPVFMVTTVLPWMIKIFGSPIFASILPSDKDVMGFGKVMAISKKVSAERFGPHKKVQKDMLGSFVAHGLTQEEAESEILLQIVAGSDTTATAIRATMLHLITNPRVLAKLLDEIRATTTAGPLISDSEARALPYLQAVIKEGLRIFPPVAGLMAKEVPPGGDTWKGVFLPGGTRIGYGAWGIFRNRGLWGADADEFRPERWLGGPPEKIRELESTLDLVFSYGRWQCLGRPVAMMELSKVFFEIPKRFDLSIVDPTRPWKSINCGIFAQSEFWVRATHRSGEE